MRLNKVLVVMSVVVCLVAALVFWFVKSRT